jgi:ABC-2 type transport system ATP-binding protein
MSAALIIGDLVKSYGGVRAVDHLSLTIDSGQIYALLGPNGAGKTTTLRIVVGLLAPDSGSVAIAGIDCLADPVAAKRVTAWLPDEPMVYDALDVEEYLAFMAGRGAAPAHRRLLARHEAEGGAGRRADP